MKTITIREAREGLSHPEQLFATDDEVIVTRRGEPRLDPPLSQTIAEDREERC